MNFGEKTMESLPQPDPGEVVPGTFRGFGFKKRSILLKDIRLDRELVNCHNHNSALH